MRSPRPGADTLRRRLSRVLGASLVTATLAAGVALAAVQAAAQRDQLDASLRAHAWSERETATDRTDRRPHLHEGPGAFDRSGAELAKYAALYDARGALLAATATFRGAAPARGALPRAGAFDLRAGDVSLRAVIVPMGHDTDARELLLAVPRGALDDAVRRQLALTGSLALLAALASAALAAALARWLTRDLEAIALTARRVAGGDWGARVGAVGGAHELRVLAADLDAMVQHLATMVASQRRFVSDAAHELRAPVTALRGEVELALRRERTAEAYRESLARLHGDVLALAALVDDLLTMARARTADASGATCRPVDAMARVHALVEPAARARRVTVALEGDVDAPAAIAPASLERLLRNLVENAVRHAPEGTTVRVAAESRGERVVVTVRDEGDGVPVAQAERVFEPFVRLDAARARDVGGTGLGLAIARELARSAGGDVSLDVRAGPPGATFVASLPAARGV